MKSIFLTLGSVVALSIAAACAVADDSADMQACAKKSMAGDHRFARQVMGANTLFFSENDRIRAEPHYRPNMASEGFGALRFPGGVVADNYHWAAGKTDNPRRRPQGHAGSDNDLSFDEFIALSKTLNAEPTVVLNYLSWVEKNRFDGALQEASSWVKYANIEKAYGVKYWELGNEVYAYLPAEHATVQARVYAQHYKAMKKALRAIDATVQLGAAMPQKLGLVAKVDHSPWWDSFLSEVGADLDYIVLHDYPPLTVNDYVSGGTGFPELLQNARAIVKAKLGHEVPFHITEWNIALWDKGDKRNLLERDSVWQGLFVAESLLDFSTGGVRLATFWPLRSKEGAGLFSNDTRRYFAGGQVFKLLAPYQDSPIRYDCHTKTLRMTRIDGNGKTDGGALVVINRGVAQHIDIPAILAGNVRITGLSTLTADAGGYTAKAYSEGEFKALSEKSAGSYLFPMGALFIFKLGQ